MSPVGLTFESAFSCEEGSAAASCESCAEGGGVEPGQARRAGQAAAGVPGGRGTPTPRASRGFRFEDLISARPLDYAQSFHTQ